VLLTNDLTWVAYHRNDIFEKRLEGRSPLTFLISKVEDLLNN
jgi:hypothetical protein